MKEELTSFSYPLMIIVTMRKVKTFFDTFSNSLIPHHPYYHTILTEKFSRSLKYFITFLLATYFLFILFFFARYDLWRSMRTAVSSFVASLQNYPNNLIISVSKGTVMTNYNRPYFMWMDYGTKKIPIFVVDEHATDQSVTQYGSVALVGRNTIYVQNIDHRSYRKLSLDSISTTIDKSKIMEYADALAQTMKLFFLLFPLLLFIIIPLGLIVQNLVFLVCISAVVYFFGRSFTRGRLTYRKTLQLALHAATFPILLYTSLILINLSYTLSPQINALLITIFTVFAVHEAYWEKA